MSDAENNVTANKGVHDFVEKRHKHLIDVAQRAEFLVSVVPNATTEKLHKIAVDDLLSFEKEHNINRV